MTHPVKAFMTILGYSVIAQIANENAKKYDLEDALFFQTPTDSAGNVGLQFVPMSLAGKGDFKKGMDVEIYKEHVVFSFDVNDQIEQAYRQQVSKITIASAGSLITP